MPPQPTRLADHERPSNLLWFLAGGMGLSPTGAQLREWKRKDREYKERQGWDVEKGNFWKEFWRSATVRRGRKKKKMEEGAAEGEGEGAGEEEEGHSGEGASGSGSGNGRGEGGEGEGGGAAADRNGNAPEVAT